jgi:hypothetical protein
MNRIRLFAVCVIASLLLAVPSAAVFAQQKTLKERLVGVWTVVSTETTTPDGKKVPLVAGPNVKGLMVFTDRGCVSFQVIAELPKVAANDRMKMTLDEQKATAQGILSYFGTYSVNEAEGSFTMKIERSSYPNQTAGDAKRLAAIVGDELRITNPARIGGGQISVVLKRVE